jgi:hypothetical protein
LLVLPVGAQAQVDQARAGDYFAEAAALCERDGGRLWGVSLCGPMVFADRPTESIGANRPLPAADWPPLLGFVNAPLEWGGTRWAAYTWSMIPADDAQIRGRLLLHELFHRVQFELGLMVGGGPNDHLDTADGRYWLRLEWRALAHALESTESEHLNAMRSALAFRHARRVRFPDTAGNERLDEIREGLAQYTGTVVAAGSRAAAVADAVQQLTTWENEATFVRTFGYPLGAAYGLLLDLHSPGWTHRVTADSDLGELLMEATRLVPAEDANQTAGRYGGPDVRRAEDARAVEQETRLAVLRQRFTEGPVLVVPRGRGAFLITTGATPIPGEGTVFFAYRVTAEWGALESNGILESADGLTLRLPAPFRTEGRVLVGDGWTIALSPGWIVRAGSRAGDFRLIRERE